MASDCRNSVGAFIFFRFKRIILDIKATQILLSYTATCPDSGTVLMSLTISLFHLCSCQGPKEASELWRRALYRGVLLAGLRGSGRQAEARRCELPSRRIIAFRFVLFIRASYRLAARQGGRWKGERGRLHRSASSF